MTIKELKELKRNLILLNLISSLVVCTSYKEVCQAMTTDKEETFVIKMNDFQEPQQKLIIEPVEEYESYNDFQEIKDSYDDKILNEFNCTNGLYEYIKKVSNSYGIPYELVLVIIDQESGGLWNTNGVISSTNDYGLCQINECNLTYIKQELGYSKQEVLYDEYKNIEASVLLIKYIFNTLGYTSDNYNYEEVFGTYNGWISWRSKNQSLEYSESCMEILNKKITSVEKLIKTR